MIEIPSATSSRASSNPPLTVSGLNRLVRECLETNFPLTWVSGEISNLTYAASGHVYFSLKDAGAQARCVMWRSRAQLLGWRLENGQKVEVRALVSFYEPRGEFQLNVEAVRRAGQGDLFERFLRLKAQLEAEGLFAPEGKRPLPAFPRHMAIVTSPQAAALRDVLSTLRRRAPHVRLTLFPTPVQGDAAAEKIAAALAAASGSGCDLIILCRGGGSIEDLWAFNEEIVARAIRASAIPVVTGIGHETDFSIADFAADCRAPTPTAAAELSGPDRSSLLRNLENLERQLAMRMERRLAERQQQLDVLEGRLVHPAERIAQRRTLLAQMNLRLHQGMRRGHENRQLQLDARQHRLQALRPQPRVLDERLEHLRYRLFAGAERKFSLLDGKLNAASRGLAQLSPQAVLSRGYALAIGCDGRAVRNAESLATGETLHLNFAHGGAEVCVSRVVAPDEAE